MVVVLIVAAGAGWESAVLSLLDRHPDVVVLKRCVDVDDLLATAAARQADVAVLGLDAPGLDPAAVDHLRRHGVRPVAIAPGDSDVGEGGLRARRIGIRALVGEADLASLPGVVTNPDGDDAGEAGVEVSEASLSEDRSGDEAPGEAVAGRVVVVWGPAGAPGRTTVAAGLAAELAARRCRTTLVDADPHGGAIAQVLGILDEVSGVLAATRLAGSGALAEQFASVQRGLDAHLTVVTGLPRPDRWIEVRPGAVEALLDVARDHGHVVVDTGFSLEEDPGGDYGTRPGRNQMTRSALAAADEVVVVGNADPVGLARLARALVELDEVVDAAPVRVVVNRMRATLGWSERDIEAMVAGFGRPASVHFLPEDRGTVDRALVTGRSLVETSPDGQLVRALGALADALVAAPGEGARLRRRRAGRGRRP